jgi:hypothetical protein
MSANFPPHDNLLPCFVVPQNPPVFSAYHHGSVKFSSSRMQSMPDEKKGQTKYKANQAQFTEK